MFVTAGRCYEHERLMASPDRRGGLAMVGCPPVGNAIPEPAGRGLSVSDFHVSTH
jgi:hypothetical protein